MLKIPQRASVLISMVMNGLLASVIAVICFNMPDFLDWLFEALGKSTDRYVFTLVLIYVSAALAYAAIALLFVLLVRIRRGEVFTTSNVACLRALSWLCFAACACYVAVAMGFSVIAYAVAFACAFLGTILRVVKNAFEKAVEIKTENDFTV